MISKAYYKFKMRSAHFHADLELVHGLSVMLRQRKLYTSGNPYLFDFIDPNIHSTLCARRNTSHNRKIAINHLKKTVYSSYIKDIYEDLVDYLKTILKEAARNGFDANRLIGEHKVTFSANEILTAGSWQTITRMVSDEVFRKLENERKTVELLKKINTKLDLNIEQNIIDNALPYLEIRHLLVHNDGIADRIFCENYPHICNTPNTKIKLTYTLVKDAKDSIFELVKKYDEKIISKSLLAESSLHRNSS